MIFCACKTKTRASLNGSGAHNGSGADPWDAECEVRCGKVSAQVPAILNKNIGAVVLHAGTNDIRLRQTEILKKNFRSLVEKVRATSTMMRIIVSGPLPTFQGGIERFSRLFAFNECLQSWCQDQKLPFVDNWNLFWERPRLYHSDGLHGSLTVT
ncbi:hypothetical protein QTP70_020252 [Hemibagrus guttatus]|uniref:SGNH hydrolase-type esterase domain-containing protein n=1 Tax=Hemibagrus guttatus TaxID=175788 RepID=A0AAE0PVW4_9TELE|nr:hypothetical protein QTP70_020252 [Hemibagrus guttatus]KAK3527381.1 hypothetical protein QTP86_021908 [Hemibagrus guttatus]